MLVVDNYGEIAEIAIKYSASIVQAFREYQKWKLRFDTVACIYPIATFVMAKKLKYVR